MIGGDDGYWFIRLLLQRGLGLIYLMGFLVALNQFPPGGILPDGSFTSSR
uniref:Uncharacterized protein n=1 Tax=Geobacter sp. (strain M21) TaxID=443144 RepID=C6E3R2_GEOSM